MNKALEMLEQNGLEVQQVKIAVKCKTCLHEWQLRLMPFELAEGFSPNPNWASCWVCRQEREKNG